MASTQLVTLTLPYVRTFGDVPLGEPLLYGNSVGMLAVALNQRQLRTGVRHCFGPDMAGRHYSGTSRITLTTCGSMAVREYNSGKLPSVAQPSSRFE